MRFLAAWVLGLMLMAPRVAHASTSSENELVCPLEIMPMHEHVPQNAPALLVVFDRDDDGDLRRRPDIEIGPLRAPGGAFLELTQEREAGTNALLLRTEETLAPGAYELAIEKRCPNATLPFDKGPQAIDVKLVVDPSVPLPKTIGRAYATGPNEHGDAEVVLELSPELEAFRAVARIEIEQNRKRSMVHQRYGDIPFRDGVVRYPISKEACLEEQLDGEIHPMHVFMKAHVAGAAEDPEPLGLEARVRCGRRFEPFVPGSGPPFPQPNAASVDRGCVVGTSSASPRWLYVAAILLGLAFVRRKRVSST